jgi:hypothetical protein
MGEATTVSFETVTQGKWLFYTIKGIFVGNRV